MSKFIGLIGASILLLYSGISLSGCSVIGYNIGNTVDPPGPAEPIQVPEALSSLPANTDVVIHQKDGTEIEGVYQGTGQVADTATDAQYGKAFEQWRLRYGLPSRGEFPRLGTNVRVRVSTPPRQEVYSGRFAGFDDGYLRIHSYAQAQIIPLKMDYVQAIDDSLGQVLATREDIVRAVNSGVPFANQKAGKSGIVLERKPVIPLDQIESMERPIGGKGRWTGLAIGIAVDVAVVALAFAKLRIEAGPSGADVHWGK